METCPQRCLYRFSFREFFPHTGKNNHVCIHRHTDAQDNTRDPRQSQRNVKGIQKKQDQPCVDDQGNTGCKARQQIYNAHKDTDDHKSDHPGQKAGLDRIFAKLRSYYIGTDFFEFYIQTADADSRGQIFRLFIVGHTCDLSLSVCDRVIYLGNADQFTVIVNRDRLSICFRLLSRYSKGYGSVIVQIQFYHILVGPDRTVRICPCRSIFHLASGQHNAAVSLQLFYGFIQFISRAVRVQRVIFCTVTAVLPDKVQRTRLPQFLQDLVCVLYSRYLDADTVVSLLVRLSFCTVLLHTPLHLIYSVFHIFSRRCVAFCLIGNAYAALQVEPQINVFCGSHSFSVQPADSYKSQGSDHCRHKDQADYSSALLHVPHSFLTRPPERPLS